MISFSVVGEFHGMKLKDYKRLDDGYFAVFLRGKTERTFRFFVGKDIRSLSMNALRERPMTNYSYVVVPMITADIVDWMMKNFSLSRKLFEEGIGIISLIDNVIVMRSKYAPVPMSLDEVVQ